ncbi:hypothetical protein P170DRAFT_367275 [Aspergillus steynii IBT 23096]|uniref:Zn(2)-C6 fungal-type domain-containing protein n=1 Tax=Aspergillus steynii IBT 23096 TaxID=1392250 RepID=A0A2I2FWB3_9EURO|nr:uncharacterized protein P170DRAFT_367275 [Aspergillus steynii IBT 23096]PLB44918.1 hypothetical protein P170DRAFT_367275 [Aspergillus steynii IBT 23096]
MFAGNSAPNSRTTSIRVRPKQRASHTKSRNGCYTCKQRRVKCDENRPVCGACSLRSSHCSYPSRPRNSPNRQIGTQSEPRSEGPSEPATVSGLDSTWPRAFRCSISGPPRPVEPKDAPTTLGTGASHDSGAINMTDLKLLQHFMSNISEQLSFSPGKTRAWKTIIPEIAAENEYIMHLILALTGLDMLCEDSPKFQPDSNLLESHGSPGTQQNADNSSGSNDRYLHTVIEHHQKGIQGFMGDLENLSESNAETVFAGSLLLVAFAFASLRVKNLDLTVNEPESDTGVTNHETPSSDSTMTLNKPRLDWLYLVRGLTSVVEQQWTKLRTGPLRQMLIFSNAKDGEVLGNIVEIVPENLPNRMACFAKEAHQSVTRLKAFSRTLKSMVPPAENDSDTQSEELREQTAMPLNEPEFIEEQESTIGLLDSMYSRIKAVLVFSDGGTNGSAHAGLQRELEDAAIMGWPHMFSPGFISSLESREGAEILRCHSFVILAHFYIIGTLFETLWYATGSFEREIMKIHDLAQSTGDSRLVSLMHMPMEVIAARSGDKFLRRG